MPKKRETLARLGMLGFALALFTALEAAVVGSLGVPW